MDHKTFLKQLPTEAKSQLTARSNSAGLRHLALHLGLIMALGLLIALQVPLWGLLLIPQGIALAFLFTLQHETTHKTPFENEKLNEWVGWFCGVLIFQPFLWFRYFHLMHHRFTNIEGKDPELAGLPKPNDWPSFFWHLSCLRYWRDKAALLWQLAFGQISADYLPERITPRLKREARGMVAIYAAAALITLAAGPVLLWVWVVPLIFGFPALRLYLLAEHGRCPKVADMFLNTRTTFTNSTLRFLAWNMPYHIEHHVFPQVPFHRLPQFHSHIRAHLGVTAPGYIAFTQEYVARFDADPPRDRSEPIQ
ncbi:MAG: fatty acid desaturase [Sulfitobacter sp.]